MHPYQHHPRAAGVAARWSSCRGLGGRLCGRLRRRLRRLLAHPGRDRRYGDAHGLTQPHDGAPGHPVIHEPAVAERRVPHTTRLATAAMEALLAGPTSAERTAGLTTAVPDGTRLIGVRIQHGVATVDLSDAFASGGGSLSMQARVAQIVYTLTRFPTVKAVDFRLDGAIVETLGGEGLILDAGQTRADWRDFEPAIFVERPGIGAVLSSPFILEGTASVFEGSFMARLVDAGGKIASATVQASRGAPGRGRYRQTITFGTTAARGVLIVYCL